MAGWPAFAGHAEGAGADGSALLAVVRDLADIGVVLLMFVAGLEN